ncbi:MAG: fumarylacetoacetase [Gemmatimonas sp.]|nr:fumarylacetoacetase [Gemmatimonas sp.]
MFLPRAAGRVDGQLRPGAEPRPTSPESSLNETHDPALRSWVESANVPGNDFPIQNLPFGVFRCDVGRPPRVGVAIGEMVLDVSGCRSAGLLDREAIPAAEACGEPSLNALMALGAEHWSALRRQLSDLLRVGSTAARDAARKAELLTRRSDAELFLPAHVGDYTDFYASIHHARRVGSLFRPDNPLLPNYKWVPIGYHGRASSIVPSGSPVVRPRGQTKPEDTSEPPFGLSQRVDYECEVGLFVGRSNELGNPIPIGEAEDHIFGICLVNDWSARDIQAWEYQPLGPFLAKSFATSVSPWVVTLEALEPYRLALPARPADDPRPLPYLSDSRDRERGGVNLNVEVWLSSARMRETELGPIRLSRGNTSDLYWTFAQMIAHHSSNGCNLQPGDLLATGTVSGPAEGSGGCLIELTRGGTNPIPLPTDEVRTFLQDGDEVILRGYCDAPGRVRIGLGDCRGVLVGAPDFESKV